MKIEDAKRKGCMVTRTSLEAAVKRSNGVTLPSSDSFPPTVLKFLRYAIVDVDFVEYPLRATSATDGNPGFNVLRRTLSSPSSSNMDKSLQEKQLSETMNALLELLDAPEASISKSKENTVLSEVTGITRKRL